MSVEKSNVDIFNHYLLNTKREGIEDLLDYLKEIEFYVSPASTQYHAAYEGGLLAHSVNVFSCADKIAAKLLTPAEYKEIFPSLVICSLLHDVGKCGQFGKRLYIPNILKDGEVSNKKPYSINKDLMTLPHEVVSIVEIMKFVDLTEDEQRAIAWHNGLYGCFKYDIQGKETELYMIIHWADMWASRIMEENL